MTNRERRKIADMAAGVVERMVSQDNEARQIAFLCACLALREGRDPVSAIKRKFSA